MLAGGLAFYGAGVSGGKDVRAYNHVIVAGVGDYLGCLLHC